MAENEQQEARPMSALHRRALEQHQWDMQHQQYQWTPEELHAKPDPAGRGQQLKQPENSNGFSPENVPRSSQTGGTQNASSSSNFYSDLSTVNKASAKNWTQEEKDNFISIITTQLPYLLHQLTAPEMPKTAADERFITFMKFLEEQNVTDSLQGVAETAVSKLLESTQKVKMPLKEDLDPNIRKMLETELAGQLTSEKSNLPSSIGQGLSSGLPDRFCDFLDLLEEKKIFESLQNVVDDAAQRLIIAMKEKGEKKAPP